ncbi:hypothetical protein PQC39_gp039 [Vibrio phage Vp_R1]|uniref:Uncharacterized protein n=1 Tax=Vibrio phage Vp_R1 TaxID=2059867 RepID=A0A2H5BPZ0_9CAUD|nr:hypothetical protein PQC39_gp039 [Vibrio phage Vp_R1]AUG88403.1 hypothetical protein VPR_039 [Vibrio phage Vp_R1]
MSALVITFGDNDFGCSLMKLGDWVLEQGITKEVIEEMIKRKELNPILTKAFRSMCVLEQNRFDMYVRWESKGETLSEMDNYLNGDYYQITNAKLVEDYTLEWDNSETLIVDLTNKQVHLV